MHTAWTTEDNRYLITSEETQAATFKVWDIQDLNSIRMIGEYLGPNGLQTIFSYKGIKFLSATWGLDFVFCSFAISNHP